MKRNREEENSSDDISVNEKPVKKKNNVPETFDQISALRNTADMFKSNLFRLKLDEMMKDLTANYNKNHATESAVRNLKDLFGAIKSFKVDAKNYVKKYPGLNLQNMDNLDDVSFQFYPPKKIKPMGSYWSKSVARPELNIDFCVQIPVEVIENSDIKCYRYHDKRALYLTVLYECLMENRAYQNVEFSTLRGDLNKPILVLTPTVETKSGSKLSRFQINIFPHISKKLFPRRLFPHRGNKVDNVQVEDETPTPLYNNSIAEDMYFHQHLKELNILSSASDSFLEATLMFKVWLRQREMTSSKPDTMNGFLMTMVLVYLYQHSTIDPTMTSYQIFKHTFNFICDHDWDNGLFMIPDESLSQTKVEQVRTSYLKHFDLVFLDTSHSNNLFSRITRDSMNEFIDEAKNTLNTLNDVRRDGFEETFLHKIRHQEKYDILVYLTDLGITRSQKMLSDINRSQTDLSKRNIKGLLFRALGDRCTLLKEINENSTTWSPRSNPPTVKNTMLIGLKLDSQTFHRQLDIGPDGDDVDAVKQYQNFWGEMASLRRFRDRKIAACVAWDDVSREKGHLIIKNIMTFILQRHRQISSSNMNIVCDQLDYILFKPENSIFATELETSKTVSGAVIEKWNILTDIMSQLSDLPLRIRGIECSSQTYRYTNPFPPLPHPLLLGVENVEYPLHVEPITGAIEFEGSGNWPDDVKAIFATKIAFYLHISEKLKQEKSIMAHATKDHLDVFFEGYVFRFTIYYHRELQLLEKELSYPAWRHPTYKATLSRPILSNIIHGLHLKNPSFGMVARLALRWLHEHHFSGHFEPEAIELMVAYLYTDPRPYTAPAHYISGFIRFLRLLSSFPFELSPLIVDFDNDFSAEELNTIRDNFEKTHRKNSIFICYKQDIEFSQWTFKLPNAIVFNKMRETAKIVYNKLLSQELRPKKLKSIFKHSMKDYDVVITLNKNILPKFFESLKAPEGTHLDSKSKKELSASHSKQYRMFKDVKTYRNLKGNTPTGLFIDFDIAEVFYKELTERYSHLGLFFFNTFGGNDIGITWNPSKFLTEKKFVLRDGTGLMPIRTENGVRLVPNVFQIISDIRSIGKGIIQDIKLN